MSIEIEVVDKDVEIKDQKEIEQDAKEKELIDDRAKLKERLKLNFAKIYEMKKKKEDSYHQISQNQESPEKSSINNENHFENLSIKSKHSKQNSGIQNYSQISKVSGGKVRNSKIEMETDRELVTLSHKDNESKSPSKNGSEHFKTPSLKSSTTKEVAQEKKECIPRKYRIALIMMILFTVVIGGLLCFMLLFL